MHGPWKWWLQVQNIIPHPSIVVWCGERFLVCTWSIKLWLANWDEQITASWVFFFLNCTWLLIYIYVDDACIHSLAFSRWRWSQEVATSKHTPAKSNVKRQTRDLGIWLDIAFLPPYYSYSTVQFVQMTNSPSSRCNCFSSFFLLTSTSSSCL